MAETWVGLLRAHARHAPWNARGLAAYATTLVDAAGVRPTNAAARASLSARAVRFYVANGLLDHPDGKGTAATYGYRHLLQLLGIKIRQREGQTLGVIKRELADLTGDALERRVAQTLSPALGPPLSSAVDERTQSLPWRRIAIADGVELHVRQDAGDVNEESMHAVAAAVRSSLAGTSQRS